MFADDLLHSCCTKITLISWEGALVYECEATKTKTAEWESAVVPRHLSVRGTKDRGSSNVLEWG